MLILVLALLHPRGGRSSSSARASRAAVGSTEEQIGTITKGKLLQSDHVISDGSNETLYNEARGLRNVPGRQIDRWEYTMCLPMRDGG
ncbi:hypothetical protein J6590_044411 [Homalodisca vitripennis]|nr:hypothetical protein J6590_044411 [Homalodisca vitripennis]